MGEFDLLLTLGLLLSAALIGNQIGDLIHIPKVTAYLLVGLLMGPVCLNFITVEHEHQLNPVVDLAMGLVLFNLGCGFSLNHIRQIFKRVLPYSLAEMTLTFSLVLVGLLLLGIPLSMTLLLAALALEAAPATTILVLKETESDGPVTRYIETMVAISNFCCILIFEILFLVIQYRDGMLGGSFPRELLGVSLEIAGSLLLGLVGGVMVSYFSSMIKSYRLIILYIAFVALIVGICKSYQLSYLLACLAMGLAVANTAESASKIIRDLKSPTFFLCVIFFVIHGAEMELNKFFAAGILGTGYIVFRMAGKFLGPYLVSLKRNEKEFQRLGLALTAQAGSAIALSVIAQERYPELGTPLLNIILGTVVFFEIAGPLLVKNTVVQAGEVPLINVIHHSNIDPVEEFQSLGKRLLHAAGRKSRKEGSPVETTVKELMRKKVDTIPQNATFEEVIHLIEHSHDDTYLVISQDKTLIGVINYRDLSHTLFDPQIGSLVRADDLSTPARYVLKQDASIAEASELFNKIQDDCIPIVSDEPPPRLEGVIRKRDLVRHFIRGHQSGQESAEKNTEKTSPEPPAETDKPE